MHTLYNVFPSRLVSYNSIRHLSVQPTSQLHPNPSFVGAICIQYFALMILWSAFSEKQRLCLTCAGWHERVEHLRNPP